MSNQASRRIMKDYKEIKTEFEKGIYAEPLNDNISIWKGIIFGPRDSIWEGGIFKLTLEFPLTYPTDPPKVKFLSYIFHPNIYSDGKICLDILDKAWTPMYNISSILVSLQVLLTDPNPDSPANTTAANLLKEDYQKYTEKVRECVEKSWIADVVV